MAALFGGGVVGHHGVDVPRSDQHPQPGPAQGGEGLRAVPVRLSQDSHPVALGLQKPADDGRAEGGVIHIGVAGNQEEVVKVPPPAGHVVPAYREE